jgi:hypothetical protein
MSATQAAWKKREKMLAKHQKLFDEACALFVARLFSGLLVLTVFVFLIFCLFKLFTTN